MPAVALLLVNVLALMATMLSAVPTADAIPILPPEPARAFAETLGTLGGIEIAPNHFEDGTTLLVANTNGTLERYTPSGARLEDVTFSRPVLDVVISPGKIFVLHPGSVSVIHRVTLATLDNFPVASDAVSIEHRIGWLYIGGGSRIDVHRDVNGEFNTTIESNGDCSLAQVGAIVRLGTRLYVADQRNAAVHEFRLSTGGCVRSFGVRGTEPGRLYQPVAIDIVDSEGTVYVADGFREQVLVFDEHGEFVHEFPSTAPRGIAVDPLSGRSLWVTSGFSNRVHPFSYHYCDGRAPTIVGTGYDDVLTGTALDDVIFANTGDDVIDAGEGHDLVCAGPGQDSTFGGPGCDVINGTSNDSRDYGPTGVIAANDYATVTSGESVFIPVLDNDTDQNGQGLVIDFAIDETNPFDGVRVVEANGIHYTPPAGFVGDDDFLYLVRDCPGSEETDTAWATVVVTVDEADVPESTPTPAPTPQPTAPPVPEGTCHGQPITIDRIFDGVMVGTPGDDVFQGTEGDDVMFGYGGNDLFCGLGGDDKIFGGDGDDVIYGDEGRDRLRGGAGDDTIYGGLAIDRIWGDGGNDLIYGDGGSDRIFAGDGDDEVWAGSGADRAYGGPGNDLLNGMGGQDFMYGEAGNDMLQGNSQSDRLYGGPDNDIVRGATGKDKLYGEGGDDELFGGDNTDYLDGGDGNDFAHGQRGKDSPVVTNKSGCVAETMVSC